MYFDCPRMGQPTHRRKNSYSKKFIKGGQDIWLKGKVGFFPLTFGFHNFCKVWIGLYLYSASKYIQKLGNFHLFLWKGGYFSMINHYYGV